MGEQRRDLGATSRVAHLGRARIRVWAWVRVGVRVRVIASRVAHAAAEGVALTTLPLQPRVSTPIRIVLEGFG